MTLMMMTTTRTHRFSSRSLLLVLSFGVCFLFTPIHAQTKTSRLWGQGGERWNPNNSLLRDFTTVGYMNGDVPIPDPDEWPNAVNVLDFGAQPNNDAVDDTDAFVKAIAACPERAAVWIPVGRYVIRQQIRMERDYIVLRGQDMYKTILYMPQYLGEVYADPSYDDSYGYKGGFIMVHGGTHKSLENLTFEFRDQTKMGFWEFRGANAIKYQGGVVDSWIRNIRFRNADFGIEFGGAKRISVLHLYFDHYINRPGLVNSNNYRRTVGYVGIGMGGMEHCLLHNIEFTGEIFHDFDIINVPSYNVVSNVTGPSIGLENHGEGAHHNLYTDVDVGFGAGAQGLDNARRMHNETYWGIDAISRGWPAHPDGDWRGVDKIDLVFVGYFVDYPDTQTAKFYYENIDPDELFPRNIYLAQMTYFGKPFPRELPASERPLPPELTGDVRLLNPTDDVQVGKDPKSGSISFDGYLKFDLRVLQDLNTIAKARIKISTASRTATPFTMSVHPVNNDDWTEESLTLATAPEVGPALDSVLMNDQVLFKWWDLDVTSFVQQEWAGDKIVSLYIGHDRPGSFLGAFYSKENGNAPILVIERVPSSVPGPPSAPKGMRTTSADGHILIDWDDNTESDFAYYNVYRNPAPNRDHPVAQGLTMSEYVDISAESDRHNSEMPGDTLFFYTITAVDDHGYESVRSTEFVGSSIDPNNGPPEFDTQEYDLAEATANEAYSASIAETATDPEGDQLYYFKVSGPVWLNVAYNGTLSGTPRPSDLEVNVVVIQVSALGGRDHAVFNLRVIVSPNDTLNDDENDANTDPPTHPPTRLRTNSPTQTASPTPLTQSPTSLSPNKTASPSTTADPSPTQGGSTAPPSDTLPPMSSQCLDHSVCAGRGLLGACCPTTDNWVLACCDMGRRPPADDPPSNQCNAHSNCRALGLENECCPTSDGVYLDCCEVVPNECYTRSSCQVYSAQSYLAEQKSQHSSAPTLALAPVAILVMAWVAGALEWV